MNTLTRSDDAEDIARVLAGDRDSYAGIVRRHEVNVRSLCLSILQNSAEADDAAQEAFWKAFRSLPRFKGQAAFGTWIHQIATRECLDRIRARKRRRQESLDVLLENGAEPAAQEPRSPEAAGELRLALRQLAPDYQTVLLLREAQGMSYAEIAGAMEVSVDSVKARLQRARRALQEALRHFLPSDGVQRAESAI